MALFSRDPILLTPGPLDHVARHEERRCCATGARGTPGSMRSPPTCGASSLDIIHGHESHVCVPMQGSGTFSVEAAVNTLVPRDGHVLVLINGAYGTRLAKLTKMMGRRLSTFETAEDVPTTPQDVDRLLKADSVDHACRPHPLRDVDRHPEPAARDRRRRRAPRQEPHRRRDELVRGDWHRCAHYAVRRADRGVGQMRRRPARDGLRVRAAKRAREVRRQFDVARARPARPVDVHGKDDAVALHAADARRRGLQCGARPARRGRRPAGAACALYEELRDARRRHGRARLPRVPAARDPGADHPDVPRAARPRIRVQALLRQRPRQGIHPLSGQAHDGRDVPRRLHRRHRPGRDAPCGQCGSRHARRARDPPGEPDDRDGARAACRTRASGERHRTTRRRSARARQYRREPSSSAPWRSRQSSDDEARVDGDLVGTAPVCDEPRRAGEIDAAVRDRLAIAVPTGTKSAGSNRS